MILVSFVITLIAANHETIHDYSFINHGPFRLLVSVLQCWVNLGSCWANLIKPTKNKFYVTKCINFATRHEIISTINKLWSAHFPVKCTVDTETDGWRGCRGSNLLYSWAGVARHGIKMTDSGPGPVVGVTLPFCWRLCHQICFQSLSAAGWGWRGRDNLLSIWLNLLPWDRPRTRPGRLGRTWEARNKF